MWGEVIVHRLGVSQQVGQLAQRRGWGELSCVRGRRLPCCAWKGCWVCEIASTTCDCHQFLIFIVVTEFDNYVTLQDHLCKRVSVFSEV